MTTASSPEPTPSAMPASAAVPAPIDRVRSRFPEVPDEDAAALAAQAELLAELRSTVDRALLEDTAPALVFDPRTGAS